VTIMNTFMEVTVLIKKQNVPRLPADPINMPECPPCPLVGKQTHYDSQLCH
jgi:hypothetical protein